jgi:hypothetical protein
MKPPQMVKIMYIILGELRVTDAYNWSGYLKGGMG